MKQSFLISVVDDDEAVRRTLESFFRSLGFKVSLHSRAEDFLHALPQSAPDCLILDVGLEGMSGPDLQRELLAAGHSIPIVLTTDNANEAVQRRVMEEGAIGFLMKPFGEDDLLAAIRKALPLPP
jgi:FixJ family two-component response regulator